MKSEVSRSRVSRFSGGALRYPASGGGEHGGIKNVL